MKLNRECLKVSYQKLIYHVYIYSLGNKSYAKLQICLYL